MYTQTQFEEAKPNTPLQLDCVYCGCAFYIEKRIIMGKMKARGSMPSFCSRTCRSKADTKAVDTSCKNCLTTITKKLSELRKTTNTFCSKNCATTYNNLHKTKGVRRSKLEYWLEEQLSNIYPELEILYTDKTVINGELDIYVPSLRLAFELNGIYHYEPIHGQSKLDQVQSNDHRKFQACIEHGIELVIVDASQLKYFKEHNCQKYLEIIKTLIDSKLECPGWDSNPHATKDTAL